MPRQSLKQRPDGRYACKYKGRFFYGSTQSEALEAREAYKRMELKGIRAETAGMTFALYAAKWLPTYKSGCQTSTYNQYSAYLTRAVRFWGDKPLKDITPSDVKSLYNQELDGAGKWSIAKFTGIIRSVFESAVNDGVILRNPCTSVAKPKGAEGSHRNIESWERDLIHQSIGKHPMSSAVIVMLYAGLRRGEAMLLDIDRDVDFDRGIISVRGAVHFEVNNPVAGTTKTKAGARTIPIFAPVERVLRGQHGLIMHDADGKMLTKSKFESTWKDYLKFLTKLNIEARKAQGQEVPDPVSIRPHDLRHSFCTMLYEADVDMKSAMKWMGHANEQMIMRIYAHLSDLKQQEAVQKASAYAQKYAK